MSHARRNASLIKNIRDVFICSADEKKTFLSFLAVLGIFLVVSCIEFGGLYFMRVNATFGNPFLQAFPTFLALAAFPLLLGNAGAKIYLFFLAIYTFIIEAGSLFLALRFQVTLGADVFVVLSATSPQEAVEFIENYVGWIGFCAFLLLCFAALILLLFALRKSSFAADWKSRLLGVLLVLPFLISVTRYVLMGESAKGFSRSVITNTVFTTRDFYRKWHTLMDACKHPVLPEIVSVQKADKPTTGIIVIGESAMRERMRGYGYKRPTTPELAKRTDLVLFDNVLSPWGSTSDSLRLSLTQSTLRNLLDSRCSIVDVYRKAGFRVVFLSNQYRWGKHDGPVTMMFLNADKLFFLQEKGRRMHHDDDLLPYIDRELADAKDDRPLILFVHLIGSHTDPANRYPAGFDPFGAKAVGISKAEKVGREYDNSIAFTDRILGAIAKRVAARENPAFMLYFSDHGSVVEDGSAPPRSSRSATASVYEIPFIFQCNAAYAKSFPEIPAAAKRNVHTPFQMDYAFWGLAALAGIHGDETCEKENIFSAAYRLPAERKIAEGTIPYTRSGDHK